MSDIKDAVIQLRMKTSSLSTRQIILAAYYAVKSVILDEKQPEHVGLVYMRNYLRLLGIWPLQRHEEKNKLYTFCNKIIRFFMITHVLTTAAGLYEIRNDFALFVEDLTILSGFLLLQGKLYNLYVKIDIFDAMFAEFDMLHKNIVQFSKNENTKIHRLQRAAFCMEILIFLILFITFHICNIAVLIAALYMKQPLLINAKFPFSRHDPTLHPNYVTAIYIFQVVSFVYGIAAITVIDQLMFQSFTQITLNLKFLCFRIRQLGTGHSDNEDNVWSEFREIIQFHQAILNLSDKINRNFRGTFISQVSCSTFMICLAAFAAVVTKDQPMVSIKFQLFGLCALGQLFIMCWMGNMVYSNSLEVASAAFELHKWYEKSTKLQRSLMFLIQRAQKPIEFRAEPFYSFTFESFTKVSKLENIGGFRILGKSYSIFTLLRTIND